MASEPESPEYRYQTAIDQCDVVDRHALALYRDKRYEWLSWYELRKGDPNTIQQQLFSMMFLDLAYARYRSHVWNRPTPFQPKADCWRTSWTRDTLRHKCLQSADYWTGVTTYSRFDACWMTSLNIGIL